MMKFYGNLLALCSLLNQEVFLGATAFLVRSPNTNNEYRLLTTGTSTTLHNYNSQRGGGGRRLWADMVDERQDTDFMRREGGGRSSSWASRPEDGRFMSGPQGRRSPSWAGNDEYSNNSMMGGNSNRMVQGGSRSSWAQPHSFGGGGGYHQDDDSHVNLRSEGRPINANVEMWNGPDNTSQRARFYSENGDYRPVNARFGNHGPSRGPSTMDVRNSGPVEFPMSAGVGYGRHQQQQQSYGYGSQGNGYSSQRNGYGSQGYGGGSRPGNPTRETVQGGALQTYSFEQGVTRVEVELTSQGMPIKAEVELLQGPNTVKQMADIYSDNGRDKPFTVDLDTPGYGSSITVRNTGPMEYPIEAMLTPFY